MKTQEDVQALRQQVRDAIKERQRLGKPVQQQLGEMMDGEREALDEALVQQGREVTIQVELLQDELENAIIEANDLPVIKEAPTGDEPVERLNPTEAHLMIKMARADEKHGITPDFGDNLKRVRRFLAMSQQERAQRRQAAEEKREQEEFNR